MGKEGLRRMRFRPGFRRVGEGGKFLSVHVTPGPGELRNGGLGETP